MFGILLLLAEKQVVKISKNVIGTLINNWRYVTVRIQFQSWLTRQVENLRGLFLW